MAQAHEITYDNQDKGACPVDHTTYQKTAQEPETVGLPVEIDEAGTWHIRGFEEARMILRSNDTKQAGFNAEMMDGLNMIHNKPILYQEGQVHHQQRRQTARFFTPKAVSTDYRQFIEALSDQLVQGFQRRKTADLSDLSLALAVPVAARVVGLTNSRLPGMGKRLDAFFKQPSAQKTRFPLLTKIQALLNQRGMLFFFFLDVQPAIKARKRHPQEDVVSHLLSLKYSDPEILTECVTYAAAGMVTTREFISVAAWHFLEQPELHARYLVAEEAERFEMLHEVLRLEPVVAHLYRRASADIPLSSEQVIPQGALINLHIYANNADEQIVGAEPLVLHPGRPLGSERIPSMLMGFGDGAHRCPGSFLAIQETDIFLQRLLALKGLRIVYPPKLRWNELTTGYEIRDFQIALKI
jgi:cytochrome P450